MKKILFFFTFITLIFMGCNDDNYTVDPAYENADITAVVIYNKNGTVASNKVTIDTELATADITLKAGEDIHNLKLTASISTGATIASSMSAGYQDLSSPKTYKITSPGGTVVKEWLITVN